MKNVINYIVILSLLLISCNKNDIMKSTLPVEFTTDALTEYKVPAEIASGFSIDFTVEDPINCKIESDQDWCKVITNWNNGIHAKLEIEDNETNKNRTARVTISSPKIKGDYVIEVKQGASVFEIEGLEDEFIPEGGDFKVYVGSDSKWELESDADWITFDIASGESTVDTNPVEIIVSVKPNDEGIVRTANFTLKSSSGKVFTQEVLQNEPWETEVRIGDEGQRFDESKFDASYPLYPQMLEWKKAGRQAGIPPLESQMNSITKTFGPENTVDEIFTYLEGSDKYQKRNILLKNGEYNINRSIRLYSQNVLIGESKHGVILKLSDKGEISMYNGNNIGLRNLTIKGAWSNEDPNPSNMDETLPGKGGYKSVSMGDTKDSYVDNIRIINSASHPLIISGNIDNAGKGSHNTIRDVEIDGAYNKSGGYQGYFHIGGAYNLVTGCKVTGIRHISFQDPTSAYNVFYKNDVTQEVSFHVNDGGNNLVERNKITIPRTLGTGYCAIMGPWSDQHKVGGKNFVYRNKCLELNRNNNTPWSDDELYVGPWEVRPADVYTNFRIMGEYPKPSGKVLYPVLLKK